MSRLTPRARNARSAFPNRCRRSSPSGRTSRPDRRPGAAQQLKRLPPWGKLRASSLLANAQTEAARKPVVRPPVSGPTQPQTAPQTTAVRPPPPKPAANPAQPAAKPGRQVAEPQPAYADLDSSPDDAPPPPDDFPPGWSFDELVPNGFVLENKLPVPAPKAQSALPSEEDLALEPFVAAVNAAEMAAAEQDDDPLSGAQASADLPAGPLRGLVASSLLPPDEPGPLPPPGLNPPVENMRPAPYTLSPNLPPDTDEVRMVSVIFRQSGDKVRDTFRMHRAHGILISYPGLDRFAFLLYERGHGYQIEFPNLTTGINPEMVARLQKLVGAENVQVETLKLH